jgi:hypothetical protein
MPSRRAAALISAKNVLVGLAAATCHDAARSCIEGGFGTAALLFDESADHSVGAAGLESRRHRPPHPMKSWSIIRPLLYRPIVGAWTGPPLAPPVAAHP